MNKNKETKILCPKCGAQFAIPQNEFVTVSKVIGKDSGLGIVYPDVVGKDEPTKPLHTAQERIGLLRNAGIDVSNLFAMQGANGDEYIASNKEGMLSVLDDNDLLFNYIVDQGTIPSNRLFRRWVMAQMFHMMSATLYQSNELVGVTGMIHRFGYEYQWKMLMAELYAQKKMEKRDTTNFADRNRWFNIDVVSAMANDYIVKLKKRIDGLIIRKCKGIPYKRICGRNIFILDMQTKLYNPLYKVIVNIKKANNATQLYDVAKQFNDLRIKMEQNTIQSKLWIDAYKGSGAFFTMQNLIRFHDCIAIDDSGKRLDKYQSLAFLSAKADLYKAGGGWRLLAVLKKMLSDNDIDLKKKIAEWRKK